MPSRVDTCKSCSTQPDVKGRAMFLKPALLASAIGLCLLAAPYAQATVVYTVFNPARNFTLFIYNSPSFIVTDTTVGVAQLAFANPLNTITSVDFIPSSSTIPGTSSWMSFSRVRQSSPDTIRWERSRPSASPLATASVSATPIRSCGSRHPSPARSDYWAVACSDCSACVAAQERGYRRPSRFGSAASPRSRFGALRCPRHWQLAVQVACLDEIITHRERCPSPPNS